jgi:hypothetical protein
MPIIDLTIITSAKIRIIHLIQECKNKKVENIIINLSVGNVNQCKIKISTDKMSIEIF